MLLKYIWYQIPPRSITKLFLIPISSFEAAGAQINKNP